MHIHIQLELYLKGGTPNYDRSNCFTLLAYCSSCFPLFVNQKLSFSAQLNNEKHKCGTRTVQVFANKSQRQPESDGEKDNTLLNYNNIKKINFKDVKTQDLVNGPAVYGIHNIKNNKYYIGETDNYKHRLLNHLKNLRTQKHGNVALQNDYNETNDESLFEFIIFNKNLAMASFENRFALQAKLQNEYITANKCYNTGMSETLQPRQVGRYPSEPGVLCIKCKKNNKTGYYYSVGRQGIAGKIRQLRGKLNNNKYGGTLQRDWNEFGESNFEFEGYAWSAKFQNEKNCQQLVRHLIYQDFTNGKALYNTYYPLDNKKLKLGTARSELDIPQNDPLPKQSFAQGLLLEFNHPFDTELRPITLVNQKPIIIENNVYLSTSEAARARDVDYNVIKAQIDKGAYKYATNDQILQELLRRNWSTNTNFAICITTPKTTKGIPRKVAINDKIFPTIKAAADFLDISEKALKNRINKGWLGYKFVD
jgi:hypothetical protein